MSWRTAVRRYGDVVLAVVLAVGYAVEVTAYSGRLSVWAVPVGIVSALALAGRRRHPVLVYAVSFAGNVAISYELAPRFQANSVFAVAVFLVGLYSMGAYARGVEAWWGGGFVLASMAALALQDGDHSPAGLFFFLVFVGVPWGAGVVVRLRHDRVAELDRRNAALQEEAQRAVGAERARLARELHDVVSHAIAVSVLQARGGSRLVGRDDAAVREALAAIERTNTAALADMRRLLGLLRDADDDFGRAEPAPSLERLTDLLEQVNGSGLAVDLTVVGTAPPIPPGVDLSAYRIVQEALTNVLKHAGPDARARVCVEYGPQDVTVEVSNTGQVPTPEPSVVGHGLIGIRERVGMVGGSVDAGPADGGFVVRARLPYLAEQPVPSS